MLHTVYHRHTDGSSEMFGISFVRNPILRFIDTPLVLHVVGDPLDEVGRVPEKKGAFQS